MDNWVKICKATKTTEFIVTNDGVHPHDEGYADCCNTHVFKKLTREPGEHDHFDGKKLCRRIPPKVRTEEDKINELIDARLRFYGLIPVDTDQ